MARIRSIHPEQWTDPEFVSCSPLARILAIGLRNEADDSGIFEWNPIKLKMRVLPADNCDVDALLTELVSTGQIMAYTADERRYGLIRSFQRFQRPKEPSFKYPLPPISIALPSGYSFHKSGPSRPNISPVLPQDHPSSSPVLPQDCRKVVADGEEGSRSKPIPTSSGASAPSCAEADPRKRLFDLGVSILTKTGDSEKTARSFLAKFAKQDEGKLGEVLGHLAAHPKVEPKSYIVGAFKPQTRGLAL